MNTIHEDLVFPELAEGSSWASNREMMTALEDRFLPAYLAQARWFPGNAASRIRPKIIARLAFTDDSTNFVIVEANHQRYLLPLRVDWSVEAGPDLHKSIVARLRQGERHGLLRDVATDPAFIQSLLNYLRREISIAGSGWRLDFKPTSRLGSESPDTPLRTRAIQGEQSNSTALVGQDYVVKLYRHIEPGLIPEVEMGRFLTEETSFTHTPALLGHLEAWHDSDTYALGVVHSFVPNSGDAWAWSADRLRIYLESVSEGSEDRDKAITVRRDYLQWVRRLGCRVAEMHRALASRPHLPDFQPEPIDEDDLAFWVRDIMERAHRIFDSLKTSIPGALDQALAERLIRFEPELSTYATGLIKPSIGRCKIRHHGDLHLGQVLVADDDAVIIDFEGEPSRPVAERRRKAPAARDVAGVLRSLDYAAMTFNQQRHDSNEIAPAESRSLHAWREQSTEGFLSAYQEAMGTSALWPDRTDEAKAMLNFFLLEKALYEVEYELSYRPTWVSIPLRGVLRILEEGGVLRALSEATSERPI
jgi:trehalose synthase-fused probable maltokinase